MTKWQRGTRNSASNFLQSEQFVVGVEQDNWYISVRQLPPSCPPTTIRLLLLSFIVSKEVPDKARGNEGPGTREISRPEKVCLSHIKVSGVSLSLQTPRELLSDGSEETDLEVTSKAYQEVDEAQNFLHFSMCSYL